MARKDATAPASATAELDACIARYSPEVAAKARSILRHLRARIPGAVLLVYDNYNALAIGFGPSERASEAVISVALYPRWINLFFLQRGPALPDPQRLLKGAGTTVRHVRLDDVAMLATPGLDALIAEALHRAKVVIDPAARGRIVIKSISAKQRPRRP